MAKYEGVTNSNGKCQIRWMEDRRRSKVLPIPFTDAGVKKAYRVRAQYIQAWAAGVEVDRGECPTFQHFAKVKLSSASWRPSSAKLFKSNMNNHWLPFSDRPINSIHYDELLQHFAPLLSGQVSTNHMRSIIYAGSSVFRLAIKAGWIDKNVPRMLIDDVGKSTRAVDPFSKDERDALLKHLTGDALLYWTIRFYMGLRPGEVMALRWPDVRGDTFSVTKAVKNGVVGPTKTGVERDVPISHRVAVLLKKHPRRFDCDAVIVSRAGKAYTNSQHLNARLAKAMEREGIRYRNPYNARHTCASMMLSAGMKPNQCADYLGHSVKTFFAVYTAIIDEAEAKSQAEIMRGLE